MVFLTSSAVASRCGRAPRSARSGAAVVTADARGGAAGVAGLDLGCGGAAGDGRFDAAAGEYRLHARGPVQRGQQVLLCYGVHTNLQLLGAAPGAEGVEGRSKEAGTGRVMCCLR